MNGTSLVAVEGRIPVVPLRLHIHRLGSPRRFPLFRRGSIEVRFGAPLSFPPGTGLSGCDCGHRECGQVPLSGVTGPLPFPHLTPIDPRAVKRGSVAPRSVCAWLARAHNCPAHPRPCPTIASTGECGNLRHMLDAPVSHLDKDQPSRSRSGEPTPHSMQSVQNAMRSSGDHCRTKAGTERSELTHHSARQTFAYP